MVETVTECGKKTYLAAAQQSQMKCEAMHSEVNTMQTVKTNVR